MRAESGKVGEEIMLACRMTKVEAAVLYALLRNTNVLNSPALELSLTKVKTALAASFPKLVAQPLVCGEGHMDVISTPGEVEVEIEKVGG